MRKPTLPVSEQSTLNAIGPLLIVAALLAMARIVLESLEVEAARYVGVYYLMPVVLLVFGQLRPWTRGWKNLAKGIALLGLLVFLPFNIGSYVAANFDGLSGMRYGEDRMMTAAKAAEFLAGDPESPSEVERVFGGVATGLITGLVNSLWCLIFATVFVWRPLNQTAFQGKQTS